MKISERFYRRQFNSMIDMLRNTIQYTTAAKRLIVVHSTPVDSVHEAILMFVVTLSRKFDSSPNDL